MNEHALRTRLGIPSDASQVLVICESTHWDPDWLATSSEYFRLMVKPTLDQALDELAAEPRRIFDVECVFFVARYWEQHRERRDQIRQLVNEGRLRFTGSGVTTPDTLIPEDELLVRDLLEGNQWLRDRGMDPAPRVLYLPDSFGHSPGLPALLAAAGVPYASVCRIDGMRFPGAELEDPNNFPVPDTSAATLTEAGSADFIWRAPDGSEALAHWHAFGYGHGDMLASGGLTRAMGLPLHWPSRRPDKVASRVEGYIAQLAPLAATPYLLLSLGIDFARPVPRLIDIIDEWNATSFERSGTWIMNAGLDDYFDLVDQHRAKLPTLEFDPNPYWTGFYATRPALKRAARDLGRQAIAADHRAAARIVNGLAPDPVLDRKRSEAWWTIATSNHHDFVTGTAPDRVARKEQWPMLTEAKSKLDDVTGNDVAPTLAPSASDTTFAPTCTWRRDRHLIHVETPHFHAVFNEAMGGTLWDLRDATGTQLLAPNSLSLTAYRERGGLWRMGMEFPGGKFEPIDQSANHHGSVRVVPASAGIRVLIATTVDHRPVRLSVEFADDAPVLVVQAKVIPRLWRTVTLACETLGGATTLTMAQPGGNIDRPLQRRYDPTYWPLHSWAAINGDRAGTTMPFVVAAAVPTALHANDRGGVEVVVARNAPRELAWGVVPLLGPATGHEAGFHANELGFSFSAAPSLGVAGRRLQRRVDAAAGRDMPSWLVAVSATTTDSTTDQVDRGAITNVDDVEVVAVKPAQRGDGIIVRLRHLNPEGLTATRSVRLSMNQNNATITKAWLCTTNEADRHQLAVTDGLVDVAASGYFTTIRLLVAPVDRAATGR